MSNNNQDSSTKPLTYDLCCAGYCLVVGLFAGWVDFHNNEAQAAALLLILFGSLLGFTQPAKAWRWALLLGLCMPGAYLIGLSQGYKPKSWPQPNVYATVMALIPAFIGVYSGVVLNKAAMSFGKRKAAS